MTNTFTKELIKRWNATTDKHFTGTIRHTYTQQTTQHTVVATFQFFDAGGCGIKP